MRVRVELEKSLNVFQQLAMTNGSESPDPTPLLGEAGVQFDLENYSTAREIILPLLTAGRLGDGQGLSADAYWEATYELLASNAALAAQGKASSDEQSTKPSHISNGFTSNGAIRSAANAGTHPSKSCEYASPRALRRHRPRR